MASSVQGMFAPSATSLQPLLIKFVASFASDLILCGARERAVRLDVPQRIVFQLNVGGHEDRLLELLAVFADASAANILQFHDPGQLFAIDSIRIVNYAVGIGERERLRTQIQQLLDCVLRNIAAAGDQAELAWNESLRDFSISSAKYTQP